jgi:simple sugar transport system permease protein
VFARKRSADGLHEFEAALMFLSSGFQLRGFSNFLVDFVWDAFLLVVIALDALRNRAR